MTDPGGGVEVVATPTYMADIRWFFRPEDIAHMDAKGIELGTYDALKRNALAVFAHTVPPNADMPPDDAGKWSVQRAQTFKNWITNGCPLGVATARPGSATAVTGPPGGRVRKNVASLSPPETETLTTAFTTLMNRDPSDVTSYFALAGIHGLPQSWCLHHENRYNPWHRTYLKAFEDALRTVPGCEDVTLPYWNIRSPLPDLFLQAPFATYTLPQDPGAAASPVMSGYFPYETRRNTAAVIKDQVQALGVLEDIDTALTESRWGAYNLGGYQDFSIQAHDSGHLAIGPTMADQHVAAFDPVFWFYHCNLDRLWLSWQVNSGADTPTGFKSTIDGDADWLSAPLDALPPFPTTVDSTIAMDIAYDELEPGGTKEAVLENMAGSIEAARSFSIKRSSPVSVRVKAIDRLAIPGSFVVNLLADGEPIAKRGFFQPNNPRNCETCRQHGLINVDFRLDQEQLLDRKMSVTIEVPGHEEIGTSFPLAQAGNPSINVRLLLQDE